MKKIMLSLAVLISFAVPVSAEDSVKPEKPQIPWKLIKALHELLPQKTIGEGDVLGIFIGGVVGEKDELPPVKIAGTQVRIGYPFAVSKEGKLTLPFVDPVNVRGLTAVEALEKIRIAYVNKDILTRGQERVFVTIMHSK